MALNLHGLFNAKATLVDNKQWYYLTHNWGDKGIQTFPKGISLKVTVIVQLEIKLTYFEATVQHFSHYTMETPTLVIDLMIIENLIFQ